jgi:hypothetical protein
MMRFGATSLFLAPSAVAACLIYDMALVGLTLRERRQASKQTTPQPATPMAGGTGRAPLPSTCRKPSIFLGFFFMLVWMVSFGFNISFLSFSVAPRLMAATIAECIFAGIHVGTLGVLVVLCIKERRRWVDREGQLKWYQLGYDY